MSAVNEMIVGANAAGDHAIVRIGRAFSPRNVSRSRFLGRCPRLVWLWAFGPQIREAPQTATTPQIADVPVFHTALSTFAPCSLLPRQRRIFIPAWGNAPGSPPETA